MHLLMPALVALGFTLFAEKVLGIHRAVVLLGVTAIDFLSMVCLIILKIFVW